MAPRNIAVMVGSIRRDSFNRQLAVVVSRLLPDDFYAEFVRIDDLPIYNQDLDGSPPAEVVRLKAQVAAADALMFVTPEHNRSVTTALKNAIDWASRPYGKNLWAGKPAAVLGASVSVLGSAMAQQHLRNILAYLDVPTLGQPEVFIHFKQGLLDGNGNVADESVRQFLLAFVRRYVAWIGTFKIAKEVKEMT